MIVTMRSWTDLDSEQRRRVAREDRRRLRLAFGLALGLQAGFLALTGALMAEPSVIPIRLEGGEAPITVMLLAMDAGRTARLAPATAPASVPVSAAPSVKAVPHPPAQPAATLAVASPAAAVGRAAPEPVAVTTPPAGPQPVEAVPEAADSMPAGALPGGAAGSLPGGAEGRTGGDARTVAAPGSSGGAGIGNASPDRLARHPYFARLMAWLQRHKTYPAELKRAKKQGTVLLNFSIGRRGELLSARVAASSGEPMLDQAALAMLQRASPMPALPDDLGLDTLTLTVPVEYSLITR
jgi:protein TonB